MQILKGLTSLVLTLVLFLMTAAVVQAEPAPTVVQAAPATTGEIQGTVKDALGRPLSEAGLTLKTPDEKIVGKAKSDADGHFVFSGVAPGTYAVFGEKTGFQASTAIVMMETGEKATTTLTLTSEKALNVSVVAERLTKARNGLSPKTGGSEYSITEKDITSLPEGSNTSFNQVLLQAPGVANDSFGQLHIRGDHANIQYRINGVILPEGITGFGQAFDTRFVDRINLLTGAMPAQYGFRDAGVVEIETKSSVETGGQIELYGGSRNTIQPSFSFGGSKGDLTYYATGSYLEDDLGIENPTPNVDAIHDHTDQIKGFGYLSYLLSPTTKVSLMFGSYDGWFQIPDNPGQPAFVGWATPPSNPGFVAGEGFGSFNSSLLNERQYETNRYGVVALQSSIGSDFDYQLSLVPHYTSVHFIPDTTGDLVFNGVAADIFRSSFSLGLQGDGSYRLNDAHTIRMGLFASDEHIVSDNSSTVFAQDSSGTVSGAPFTVVDDSKKNGNTLLGLYLQDEWKMLDKLTVNYGLRFDEVDAFVKASQLSPRLGLVYKVTPDTTLHAAYARYFTPPPTELVAPETLALFANTTNAPANTLNSPVLPERSHYFDVGATQKITPAMTVGVDGFYKIVQDLIDEGQFGQALIFTPFNYDKGKIYGVELTGNYRSGNFAAYANLARTVSLAKEVVSGQFNFGQDELDYISNHWVHTDHDQTYTASAGLSYNLLGTELSADGTYGSGLRSGFANTDHVPANVQVNLGATHKFALWKLGQMEARADIVNLFDKVNEIRSGTGIGVFAPQYGPRRGFYGGISKLF